MKSPPNRTVGRRLAGQRVVPEARSFRLRPARAAPTVGGGARTAGRQRAWAGADEDWGSFRRGGEGQGVTGVCDRGRWLLQAQGADPGRVLYLPMPAHPPVGDSLGGIV